MTLTVDTLSFIEATMMKDYKAFENATPRFIVKVLKELYEADIAIADIAKVIAFDSSIQWAELHSSYSPRMSQESKEILRREVYHDFISGIFAELKLLGKEAQLTAGANDFKVRSGSEFVLWSKTVAGLFWPNGLKTIKSSIYVGLLDSLCHVSWKGLATFPAKGMAVDGRKAVTAIEDARAKHIAALSNLHAEVADTKLWSAFCASIAAQTTLGGLQELLADGSEPLVIPTPMKDGVRAARQERCFGKVADNGELAIAKYFRCSMPVVRRAIECAANVSWDESTIMPGNVKSGHSGTCPAIFGVSQWVNPKHADSRPVSLGHQMIRFDRSLVDETIWNGLGWAANAKKMLNAFVNEDAKAFLDSRRVKDNSVGYSAITSTAGLQTILRSMILPTMGKSAEEALFNDRQRGTFSPISSHPDLPIMVRSGKYLLGTVLVPENIGIEVGDLVWASRSPAITPWSNLPSLVIGKTNDGTIGVHPLICKWVFRGDFDGDPLKLIKLPSHKMDAVIHYWGHGVGQLLDKAVNGQVEEVVMVARNESYCADEYARFAAGLINNGLLGMCDVSATLILAILKGQLGLEPAVLEFCPDGKWVDAYTAFCLLEAHTDMYKKRPERQIFASAADFEAKMSKVRLNGVEHQVSIKSLEEMRNQFWPTTTRRNVAKAITKFGNDEELALNSTLEVYPDNKWDRFVWKVEKAITVKSTDSLRAWINPNSENAATIWGALWANVLSLGLMVNGATIVSETLTHNCLWKLWADLVTGIGGDEVRPLFNEGDAAELFEASAFIATLGDESENMTLAKFCYSEWVERCLEIYLTAFEKVNDEYTHNLVERETLLSELNDIVKSKRLVDLLVLFCRCSGYENFSGKMCAGKYVTHANLLRRVIPHVVWKEIAETAIWLRYNAGSSIEDFCASRKIGIDGLIAMLHVKPLADAELMGEEEESDDLPNAV